MYALMHYTVTKKITPRTVTSGPVTRIISVMVILVAIPVIVIALLSFLVVVTFNFVFSHVTSLFIKKKADLPAAPFYLEREMLNNEHVQITAVEDEEDTELTELNELWTQEVGSSEIYFYRAKTKPFIPGLEGRIICFFLKQQPDGVILQITDPTHAQPPLSTQLVFLQYGTLQVIYIDTIGPFCLYNDEKKTDLIKGFNTREELSLCLVLNQDLQD